MEQNQLKTAEVEEAVPDGRYQVNVDRVELSQTGDPILKWTLRILTPTHKDRLLRHNNLMLSKMNIFCLKWDLCICGLELQKFSDLPKHLDQLLNIKLEVDKRTCGEHEKIYFYRRLDMTMDDTIDDKPDCRCR